MRVEECFYLPLSVHVPDTPKEKIVKDRLWNKRPDAHELRDGPICKTGKTYRGRSIRVHKVNTTKNPRSPRMDSESKKFLVGARSLNEKDFQDNLTYFNVPQTDIDSIRPKLTLKIFDEYVNILKGMYSTRFNGNLESKGDHNQKDTVPDGPSPPLFTSLQV